MIKIIIIIIILFYFIYLFIFFFFFKKKKKKIISYLFILYIINGFTSLIRRNILIVMQRKILSVKQS